MASDDTGQKRGAPPYVPYQTFKTFIGSFKEHVIPNRIDRSLLKGTSVTIQNQVMSALKFFDLIDGDARPTEGLRSLVDAYGGENWSAILNAMLREAYSDLFSVQLETASAREFSDKFRDAYQAEGETYRKASTFFLKAAREAGITLSPYLTSGAKPSSTAGNGKKRQRTPKQRVAAGEGEQAGTKTPQHPNPPKHSDMASQLLAKFPEFDPEWPDAIKAKWFEGYERLLSMGGKDKGAG